MVNPLFDFGIVEMTHSHVAKLRCGCIIQNYNRITMWSECSVEHAMIFVLGWELESARQRAWEILAARSTRR